MLQELDFHLVYFWPGIALSLLMVLRTLAAQGIPTTIIAIVGLFVPSTLFVLSQAVHRWELARDDRPR